MTYKENDLIQIEDRVFKIIKSKVGASDKLKYQIRKVKTDFSLNQLSEIREYAKNYHYPINDIKGLNEVLRQNGIISENQRITKKIVIDLLNY